MNDMTGKTGTIDADLVVVGAGGAGLPAAVTASEKGAGRIVVLEKRAATGGNARRAWGIFAADSHLQKRAMVHAYADNLFKTIMAWSHWTIDPGLFLDFLRRSGDTVRWLEDMGVKFELIRYYPGQEPPVWHVPARRGAELVEVLSDKCAEMGIRVILQAAARKISCGEGGRVTSVTADVAGGVQTFNTRSVIIATGGFGGNRALLEKYCPQYDPKMRCLGMPHTGDGIIMATEIGAATAGLGFLHLEWPNVHGDATSSLSAVAREPYTIYVNHLGERFVDESLGQHAFECCNAVLRQKDKAGYILLDERIRRNIEAKGVLLGRGNARADQRWGIPGLGRDLQNAAAREGGPVKISNSWDEIGAWLGAAPGALPATVVEYNCFCARKYDAGFVKDPTYLLPLDQPPYYAIRAELIFLETIGGLKVNRRMEVLDRQDRPIPGLFAAGVDTGGWEPDTYCDILSGTAFGFSVHSGRLAGENAARFISGAITNEARQQ
jgi:fumarate reductase flavoprotein subunit